MSANPRRFWPEPGVVVFTGAFGSGKTEVAINYALAAQAGGIATCLIDLDVVTPYFRVGDYRDELQKAGVRIVAPEGKLASFELPALTPAIAGALADRSLYVVVDVGGDPDGARLLGVYAEQLRSRGCEFWLVANPFRPTTADPASIVQQARAIEAQSRLHLTGLVANPNVGPSTRVSDIDRALVTVREAARRLGRPIALLAVEESLIPGEAATGLPVLPMKLVVRLPWE